MKSAKCTKKIGIIIIKEHIIINHERTDLYHLEIHGNLVYCYTQSSRKENTHAEIASCVYSPSTTPVLLYPHFEFPARQRQNENKQQSAAPVMQVPSRSSTGTPNSHNPQCPTKKTKRRHSHCHTKKKDLQRGGLSDYFIFWSILQTSTILLCKGTIEIVTFCPPPSAQSRSTLCSRINRSLYRRASFMYDVLEKIFNVCQQHGRSRELVLSCMAVVRYLSVNFARQQSALQEVIWHMYSTRLNGNLWRNEHSASLRSVKPTHLYLARSPNINSYHYTINT